MTITAGLQMVCEVCEGQESENEKMKEMLEACLKQIHDMKTEILFGDYADQIDALQDDTQLDMCMAVEYLNLGAALIKKVINHI